MRARRVLYEAGVTMSSQTLSLAAPTRHHPTNRPPRHRVLRSAGPTPLGSGTYRVLVERLPPSGPPLRTRARAFPGLRRHRRHPHLIRVLASNACRLSGRLRPRARPCGRGPPWWTDWRNRARHRGGIGQVVDRGSSRPRGASLALIRAFEFCGRPGARAGRWDRERLHRRPGHEPCY